jgi:hypothetical protein
MSDRCEAGDRCRAYDPAARQPFPSWPLCDFCLESAERDVRALVLDYRDLEQHLPPSLGQWGDGQPRSRSTALPLSVHVLDLQIEIHSTLDAWDDVVRDRERLSDKPQRVRDGWAVQQAVSILAPRLHILAGIPMAVMWSYPGTEGRDSEVPGWQGVLDLSRLHQRARSALGLTREEPELCVGVPCRRIECDLKTLYRMPGTDEVRCHSCGLTYSAEDYAKWLKLCAADARKTVRPAA